MGSGNKRKGRRARSSSEGEADKQQHNQHLYDYGRAALSPVPDASSQLQWMDMSVLDAHSWGVNGNSFLFAPPSNAAFSAASSNGGRSARRPVSATPSKRQSSKRAKFDGGAEASVFSPYALGSITDRDIAKYFGDVPMSNPCWSPTAPHRSLLLEELTNATDENSKFSAGIAVTPMRASIHASPLGLTMLMNTSPLKRFMDDSQSPFPKSSRRLDNDGDVPASAMKPPPAAQTATQTPPMTNRSIAMLRESSIVSMSTSGSSYSSGLPQRTLDTTPVAGRPLAVAPGSSDTRPLNAVTSSVGPARNARQKENDSPATMSSGSAASAGELDMKERRMLITKNGACRRTPKSTKSTRRASRTAGATGLSTRNIAAELMMYSRPVTRRTAAANLY